MSALDVVLAQDLACLAFCWRLDRRDGVTIGLTSHDRDLSVGGVLYRAAPGLVPSAVVQGTGLEPESMDLRGALTSDAITATDLEAGRWDGAGLRLYLTEWTAPGSVWFELVRGELGAIERRGDAFSAEMRGPVAVLDRPVAPETSPGCRATLGDGKCRVDLALHRRFARVASASGQSIDIAGGGMTAGDYAFGALRWMTGPDAGIVQDIADNDAVRLTLTDASFSAPVAGALMLLTAGCDKRIDTCSARFGNALNFRGEPYLPGNDLLTRYPGGN